MMISKQIPPGVQATTDIRVVGAESGTSLDESLQDLKQFLSERCQQNEGELAGLLVGEKLLIDIAILGTQDFGRVPPVQPLWKNAVTYPIRLAGMQILLGPLYTPGQSDQPCPHCLERRWFWSRTKQEQIAFMYGRALRTHGRNPGLAPFALELVWSLFISVFHQRELAAPDEQGSMPFYVLELKTLQVARYHLLQDPCCLYCAVVLPDTAESARIELVARPKRQEDTYRLVKSTDYRLPLSAYSNPVAGCLATGSITEMRHTLAAPVSGQFKVRSHVTVFDPLWSGHGDSYRQSLYLGVLEGLERYAGLQPRGRQAAVFDSYQNLAPAALDPRACGLYQPEFYQAFPHYHPFTPELKIPWVWGYSFGQGRPILVPEQLVYYMEFRGDSPSFVHSCSNGCATGSCAEEAIFYGLLELIERDAFLLTWYARLAPARIDPRSCRRPETLFVLEGIEKHGYELLLFDTRLDVRIPSILAVARRKTPGLGNIALAAGCSLNPEDAVRAALCEVACYIPNLKARLERDEEIVRALAQDYSRMTEVIHHALLPGLPEWAHHFDFLLQKPHMLTLEETYRDWQEMRPHNPDLRDDLLFCMSMLRRLGLDVIVVEQTCPEQSRAGLKTFCVIVPGLLPIDFGWRRERVLDLPRLRTVPRTAGYRTTDFEPDKENLVPHPFP